MLAASDTVFFRRDVPVSRIAVAELSSLLGAKP
jgi:hypothetical protein